MKAHGLREIHQRERVKLPLQTRSLRSAICLLALVSLVGACAGSGESSDTIDSVAVTVPVDTSAPEVVINVVLTEAGFDPSTIFVPAGSPIRLVLRPRDIREYHYRIVGLVPTNLTWMLSPDVDPSDLDAMTPQELEALGITEAGMDAEHEAHHLNPVFVPFREESRSGIKPLPNEVHGYVDLGSPETISFFATTPGTFVVEDVLHPEITGKVIVFEVDG